MAPTAQQADRLADAESGAHAMPRLQSRGHTATLRRLDLAEHITVHVQDLNRIRSVSRPSRFSADKR
jgi:hypothetical protein